MPRYHVVVTRLETQVETDILDYAYLIRNTLHEQGEYVDIVIHDTENKSTLSAEGEWVDKDGHVVDQGYALGVWP